MNQKMRLKNKTMRQLKTILVFLTLFGMPFSAANLSAVTLDLQGEPRNILPGSRMVVNVIAADMAEMEGVVLSLIYPETVLDLETITTTVFDTHRDGLADKPGMGSFWATGNESPGIVNLTGLFKNSSSSNPETTALNLFTVYFRVKKIARVGLHSMRLFPSQLCNGPAGWGTDNNNNGVFDNTDNDQYESADLLYSFVPDSGTGRDETDQITTKILLDSFDEPPLFVFNVLDAAEVVTPPDEGQGDGSDDDMNVNPVVDSDNDGVPDNQDDCPNDPLKTEPGACGCGVLDTDSDSDGIPDCHDVLIRPANGAMDVSLSPVMEVEPFPDWQAFGADAVIVWQISKDNTFSNLLFEFAGPYDVTKIRLPDYILDAYTTYYWRIRYDTGPWEVAGEFTTGADPITDEDGNGVPDDQDIEGTNTRTNLIETGSNGKILQAGADGRLYSLDTEDGTVEIDRFRWQPVDDFETASLWPVNFVKGLLSFRIRTAVPGATVTVTIGFSEKMAAGSQWWKTTVDQNVYDFGQYTTFTENMRSVRLTLTDGGSGDLDGVANGVIVDPGGIVGPETTGASGGGSGGGSSGCFIGVCFPQRTK